jgi:hypothetical protein
MLNIVAKSKILSILIAPEYKTIGRRVTTNELISKKATTERVVASKRLSRNSGIVVNFNFKNFGTIKIAAITRAMADVISHAITIIPLRYELPFIPIKCSVEILVKIIEPAIIGAVRLLPAKK